MKKKSQNRSFFIFLANQIFSPTEFPIIHFVVSWGCFLDFGQGGINSFLPEKKGITSFLSYCNLLSVNYYLIILSVIQDKGVVCQFGTISNYYQALFPPKYPNSTKIGGKLKQWEGQKGERFLSVIVQVSFDHALFIQEHLLSGASFPVNNYGNSSLIMNGHICTYLAATDVLIIDMRKDRLEESAAHYYASCYQEEQHFYNTHSVR